MSRSSNLMSRKKLVDGWTQQDFAAFRGTSEAELRGWLLQMLLRNLADFNRRYRETAKRRVRCEVPLEVGGSSGHPGLGPYAATPSPSAEAMAHEEAEALQVALADLLDDPRRVITLRQQEQLSFEEIAAQIGRSLDVTRKLWARAIQRLKQALRAPP